MINLCNTLLLKVKAHEIPADIGKTIKPTPVIDKVIEVDVAPIITNVSTDSILCLEFCNFYISF